MSTNRLDQWIMDTEALPELTREGLAALQLEKLNKMLRKMGERGGIYENLPTHLDALAELRHLPFTTAEQLSQRPGSYLLTSQAKVRRVISAATSGTMGPAKRVFYTQTDIDHTVGFFAAGISEMLGSGERCLIDFPAAGPDSLGDLIARAVVRLGAVPIVGCFGATWSQRLDQLRQERPGAYIGFPVTLLGLKRLYGPGFPIEKALISGDACPTGVMAALEMPLFPHYGSRECGLGGAVTCPVGEGMHLRENHILAEIVDEAGNVLPEGEDGELVLTTIGLEAMPLLRYRTGDITRLLPPCPCGSPTRRIGPVTRRGGQLAMEALDHALFAVDTLVDYEACFQNRLVIRARTTQADQTQRIEAAARTVYSETQITAAPCQGQDRPFYAGKRYLRKAME